MPKFIWGYISGVATSLIAASIWVTAARFSAYRAAGRLIGTWEAHNIDNREIEAVPMPGAGPTEIYRKYGWWSAQSGVLAVRARDIDASTAGIREHKGEIVFDGLTNDRARRTVRYSDSSEIAEQILRIDDSNTIFVFPIPETSSLGEAYRPHVLRRIEKR